MSAQVDLRMRHDDLHMSLLASPAVPGLARTLVEQRLVKWGLNAATDDVLLVTTELVTNASAVNRGQIIELRVRRDGASLLIEVWDPSNEIPTVAPFIELNPNELDLSEESFDANGGWGLRIVQALATDCGYQRVPSGGKVVWARMAATPSFSNAKRGEASC